MKLKANKTILGLALAIGALFSIALLANNLKVPSQEALDYIGEPSFSYFEKSLQNLPENKIVHSALKIPIFIYHSVRPYINGESQIQDDFDVTPELLERQLSYLKDNGYATITLDQFVADIENGTTGKINKPVMLTFDDGWRNQYKYAFPLLKKYGLKATFYVYTNPIDHHKEHFLTWDEIKEMDEAGMTIGSHTVTHPYLSNLPQEALRREIALSKQILEKELGKPVLHFASPFGYIDPQIMQIVKDARYKTARTTYKGIYHTKDDLLQLRGILVGDNFNDFVKVLNR